MNEDDPDLDQELRRLASRPPRTAPGDAARQVLARIPPSKPRPPLVIYAYVGAVLAVVALVAFRLNVDRVAEQPAPPAASVQTVALAPLPDNVVLWWIDPDTPVYFAVAPPDAEQGGGS
jgi:hypothetical protein